ncbi:hypothetical protein G6F29_009544 [Rhizopus arrhizus]|jgi:hypothetical protein|nr:hypothetical protein G6F23_008626 [Rhizopus arrhizus]KAG0978134.1 hypothetical protein G6F29_009544 [Rhizopus arrhizus]KAG1038635.1 hypothetical protein G6F25_006204 [Rhizopus arrhizus]KAG1166800.1 hypothetical protein G6F35_017989 [Rhizopus arrhizus]KAG1324028.1 hypothetical protein G6F62_009334 [Rhizopus arrhizus]
MVCFLNKHVTIFNLPLILAPTSATTVQYYPTQQDGHIIDMNRPYHPPSTSQQPVYRPADTSAVEPPPPSYQDYAKDQRIHS